MSIPIAAAVDYKDRNSPSKGPVATLVAKDDPTIDRSVTLRCIGDWGHANFHRIMAFLTQEITERCGPTSRTCIWSVAGGGMEITDSISSGFADIAINTPVKLIKNALTGTGPWESRGPAPHLRGIATIPQNDRMLFAIDPSLGCKSFADIRQKKPKLKIILGPDGESPIGYVCHRYLEAHGVSVATIKSWGGEVVYANRPEECLVPCQDPSLGFNAVINEALMTDWWVQLIDGPRGFRPMPAEPEALALIEKTTPGLPASTIPAGYWKSLKEEIPALEFLDFILMCREDLPEDVAYLITWVLVKKKAKLEVQFHGFPGDKAPVSWPMDPREMAKTVFPLHPGADRFYREHGYLD
ncbi:hypothetical protein LCI18_013661 [Fusarium solani-melongenae]|uniref:Uncharacterized protein n=2 Tax=Fusarium solani subsp. cucurbitae TaxID=2747967 RepID=A0ACD3ZKV3_FUSSC|nr:hypothetical protein LCI18_012859 [Fusarium solani-melongenae]UPL02727.1 hypothetical protein LCI18_013661 [Fusarium solani-melongenae]